MKAKRKPLDIINIDETIKEFSDKELNIQNYEPPQARQKGVMVESVDELVAMLKEKGLVK